MDFVKFFTREEHIAGLEVDDGCLRLVLLEHGSRKRASIDESAPRVVYAVEEKLEPGVVESGVIVNEIAFKKALVNLRKKTKRFNRFVVLSLPTMRVYTHMYLFPQFMEKEKITEAVKLLIDFQLPMKPEKIYWDWEQITDKNQNLAFLAVAERVYVDKYIKVLSEEGWSIVATEFYAISLMRAMKSFEQDYGLLVDCRADGITITAIKDNIIHLSRFVPAKIADKSSDLKKEVEGMLQYFQVEIGEQIKKIYFTGDNASNWFAPKLIFLDSKLVSAVEMHDVFFSDKKFLPCIWAVAIGAGKRGLLLRNEDKLVSLMPIGTERAYEQQKALAFADFVFILTVSVTLLFVFLYAGAWTTMIYLQQLNISKLASLSAISLPTGTIEQEQRALDFNVLVEETGTLVRQIPLYSKVLEEIKKQLPTGVDITSFNMASPEGEFSATGVVLNRTLLNSFKNNLESSALFTNISIPVSHIGQKENIPFSVSMSLSNPQSIYFQ